MLALDPEFGLQLATSGLAAPGTLLTLLSVGLLIRVEGRRRRQEEISRAIHELRRPLQALMLAPPSRDGRAEPALTALDLALAALGDLESLLGHDVHRPQGLRAPQISWRRLLEDAADRWGQAAWLRGGSIELGSCLDWGGPEDGSLAVALSRALDNLIVNALVHGGPQVELSLVSSGRRLSLTVTDRGPRPASRRPASRRHHGHGLQIVAGIAARLGGSFQLQRGGQETTARLDFPCRKGVAP